MEKSESQGARLNFGQDEELTHVLCSFQQKNMSTIADQRIIHVGSATDFRGSCFDMPIL
jgi:hypothetical protein